MLNKACLPKGTVEETLTNSKEVERHFCFRFPRLDRVWTGITVTTRITYLGLERAGLSGSPDEIAFFISGLL